MFWSKHAAVTAVVGFLGAACDQSGSPTATTSTAQQSLTATAKQLPKARRMTQAEVAELTKPIQKRAAHEVKKELNDLLAKIQATADEDTRGPLAAKFVAVAQDLDESDRKAEKDRLAAAWSK